MIADPVANRVGKLRLLPFDASGREKVAPHRTLSHVKSNKYRKRERDRASTGGKAQHSRRDAASRVSRRERQGKPVSLGKGKSRLDRGLSNRGRGIIREVLLGGLRPLDVEPVEQRVR